MCVCASTSKRLTRPSWTRKKWVNERKKSFAFNRHANGRTSLIVGWQWWRLTSYPRILLLDRLTTFTPIQLIANKNKMIDYVWVNDFFYSSKNLYNIHVDNGSRLYKYVYLGDVVFLRCVLPSCSSEKLPIVVVSVNRKVFADCRHTSMFSAMKITTNIFQWPTHREWCPTVVTMYS